MGSGVGKEEGGELCWGATYMSEGMLSKALVDFIHGTWFRVDPCRTPRTPSDLPEFCAVSVLDGAVPY